MTVKNAFYAQSGGVTAVINASACGVIETARKHKDKIGKVFAARNGIVGALIIRHTYKLLTKVSYLESILPVCASCGKIRGDKAFWTSLEHFVADQANTGFIHGICPDCIKRYSPELHGQQKNNAEGSE